MAEKERFHTRHYFNSKEAKAFIMKVAKRDFGSFSRMVNTLIWVYCKPDWAEKTIRLAEINFLKSEDKLDFNDIKKVTKFYKLLKKYMKHFGIDEKELMENE